MKNSRLKYGVPRDIRRKLRNVWRHMIDRCTNSAVHNWNNYGGRGIRVCDRWFSFANFMADMSKTYVEGLSLDRIDVNKGYSPDNCKWTTRKEQNRNKRNNTRLVYNGRRISLAEFEELTGYIVKRKSKNVTSELIITTLP